MIRSFLLAAWAGALFAIGVGVGVVVTFVLFSAAALVAGYRRGRE